MRAKLTVEPIQGWPAFGGRPYLVCGPCAAESREQILSTARALVERGITALFRAGVWKGRTRPGHFEGVGAAGLAWLAEARAETGLPVVTEVAGARHVELALEHGIDCLWIGARTTSNPFAVQEIAGALAGSRVPVLVKNPVSPDVDLWLGAFERLAAAGLSMLAGVHRGFFDYGRCRYRNPPQWRVAAELRRRLPSLPLLCDPSHIGGDASMIAEIAEPALRLGYEGLMIECHARPEQALCDGRQQMRPDELLSMLDELEGAARAAERPGLRAVSEPRMKLEELDERMMETLERSTVAATTMATDGRVRRAHLIRTWDDARCRRAFFGLEPGEASPVSPAKEADEI